MSANEQSLTFLLKMDGGQSVAQEFQRLTAQISSQLAGLNKPNDGAAAAAIGVLKEQAQTAKGIVKEVAQSAVTTEAEKNKQIEAMWVQRQSQVAASLTKEARIAAAYASQETLSARESQNQIVSAHQQRARQVDTIGKQEQTAWAKHEADKLSATKQAEKQGEAIVAQGNVAKEQSSKKSETRRVQQTREALRDIERLERERIQIATQNEKAIERLAKTEADSRIRESKRAANTFLQTLRDLQREESRLRASVAQRASGGTNAFLAGAVGGITALVGVSVVSEIRQAGEAWLDYSNKLQTTKIAFTTMLGSEQLAEEHLKELQQFALKTPFQFGELIDASQRMQALGFRAEQVIPVLTDVGNAVAAAGGGSERLDRVTLALSQIQSKGKVMTQELNQLAEAGIPAFRILQQELGKSRAEINEMTKDGVISSKVFLDAFQKFSQQNFGGLMEAQSKTFSGAMSNIKDALLQTSQTAFAPLFEKLSKLAVSFSEAATSSQDFQNKLKTVGSAVSTIFDGMVEVVLAFRDAIRLMVAAVSAQFELFTGTLQAVSHALAAVFFEAFAAGRALRGDLAGAARAHQEAQNQLRIATEGAQKAFESQGKVIKEVAAIYKEAEERAKALKAAQPTVGVDPTGGITFRKRQSPETNDDVEKKTKGVDPAATEQRLAELRLANDLARLNDEEDQLKRSLARREILFTRYSQAVTLKENERHARVIAGLEEEQRAAEKLRKSNQQQIQLQDIANKFQAENIRHKNEQRKLTDDTESNARKQTEATTSVLRTNIDAQLRILEIGDQQRIAGLKTLADARVRSEEETERAILKIRLDANTRGQKALETELKATVSIQDPEEQLKAQAKLNADLRVLKAEHTAIETEGERAVDEARKRDLENVRRYAQELKAVEQQIVDIQRENAEAILRLMEFHFAARKDILRQRLQIDIEDENARHRNAQQGIDALKQENRESNRTQQEKLEQEREIHRLEEEELRLHNLRIQSITAEGKAALEREDPLSTRSLFGDSFKEQFDAFKQAAIEAGKPISDLRAGFQALAQSSADTFHQMSQDQGNFASFAKEAFGTLAQGIGQIVESYVLLGETGPAVMRKLIAQILATLAKEAAVKAIFELAEGFAMLFINPAAAGAHFTASAIYGSVAGVAAIAGRAVAGDLFKQKTASSGGLSSSQSGSTALNTITQGRNQPQVQVIRHEHLLRIVADEGKFGQALDTHFESGFRNGGKLRELILNDGGTG